MEYTITPQYHDKKDCNIYVVRLSDRISKEDFLSLSELAKSYKGYYSKFRGVNGFVFKTEEIAEDFAQDMMAVMDLFHAPSATKLPSKSTVEEETSLINPPISGMKLHKALRAIIQTEGDTIITETRLVNILDDFKAYTDMPTAKYILRAIIADGISHKLLAIGKWNNEALNLASRFASATGFMPDAVEILFKSIAFGLSWMTQWESSPKSIKPSVVPQPVPNPVKPIGPRSNGWTNKMDEDQTDDFFQSITEYAKSSEAQFKVKLENLFYIVEDSDLKFSLEITHTFRSDKWVTLNYTIFNLKGKIISNSQVGLVKKDSINPMPVFAYTFTKASNIGKIRFYWS